MKKSSLLLLLISLFSCNEYSKEESIVSNDLKLIDGIDSKKIKFNSEEVTSDSAFEASYDNIMSDYDFCSQMLDLECQNKLLENKDDLIKGFSKVRYNKFTKVHAYVLNKNDTVLNRLYYLNGDKIYSYKLMPIN